MAPLCATTAIGPTGMPSPRSGWIEATTPVPKAATPSVFGPIEPDPALAREEGQRLLSLSALVPLLAEPLRGEHDGLRAGVRARLHRGEREVGGEDDDGEVDRSGQRLERRVAADALDLVAVRVDRIDGARDTRAGGAARAATSSG